MRSALPAFSSRDSPEAAIPVEPVQCFHTIPVKDGLFLSAAGRSYATPWMLGALDPSTKELIFLPLASLISVINVSLPIRLPCGNRA